MLKDIEVEGGTVRVHVLITIEGCPLKDRIESDVTKALAPVPGVDRVEVGLSPMSEEQRAGLVAKLRGWRGPAAATDVLRRRPDDGDRRRVWQGRRGQVHA